MRNIIKPTLLAIALSTVSTIALAQSTPATESPVTKTKPVETQPMKEPTTGAATTAPGTSASTTTAPAVVVVTAIDGKKWVGKRIYDMKGNDIGEVSELSADASGNVDHFRADIGGFLGIGETHVQVKPDQFTMRDEKLYLNMTQEQAKALPRAEKK